MTGYGTGFTVPQLAVFYTVRPRIGWLLSLQLGPTMVVGPKARNAWLEKKRVSGDWLSTCPRPQPKSDGMRRRHVVRQPFHPILIMHDRSDSDPN